MNRTEPERTRQTGFSLVELMVALVVGILLLGGILQILLGNRESFQVQRRQAALEQNARLATFVLDTTVAQAGYHVDGFKDEPDVFGANAVISGTEGGGATDPDTLTIRFQAQGNVTDCLGAEVVDPGTDGIKGTADDRPAMAAFEYSVVGGRLRCDDLTDAAPAQPLVDNVENMQIEYGVDTNGDGSVDRYQDAGAADFTLVRSVRIQLLMASAGDVRTQSTAQTFSLLDGDVTPTVNPRRQRQVVDQTIALRNRLR